MWTQLFPALTALAGTVIGGLVTLSAASKQAKASREVARQQFENQLVLAQHQLAAQLEAERGKQRRVKIDEAYGQLMLWMHDVRTLVDNIWVAIFSDDAAFVEETHKALIEWPFETLRPPREFAPAQFYWSDDVNELLIKFGGRSAEFVMNAKASLVHKIPSEGHSFELDSEAIDIANGKVVAGHDALVCIVSRIRDVVKREMRDGKTC
ncbi:MAG: hypothetical protein HOQ24_12980 [Mycobacteriaceae bacterium]|nr:hypothetical protein [Mycobacteriaceae bacterium]